MQDVAPKTIHLKDYRAPAYWVDNVELTFKLHPTSTRVISKISFRPNPDSKGLFYLNGEHISLISAKIDGQFVSPNITSDGLTCKVPNEPFVWESEVEIAPEQNTALEGLYMSNGMYCTQCEAEGFRKITYYPDRPDVMAPFKVRIESDLPILLSNGNPSASGEGWCEWNDPWPKPAYLFALVAGELHAHSGKFKTMSGKDVNLNIYVRDGDQDKCDFAMQALKSSMKWDEDVYGREYDLDIFNIVAVDDFNMGAMENKGLNIFNSSAVLASPETATDTNFERIEAIIAHEYFHNWTGNRITCRDWFQLCLKEGLTVFRDQQFSADVRSAPVRRIEDVLALRGRQFREDTGPLSHPVRPESFVEINNFYTATVYDKGAEVIGMLKRLVGDDAYAKALDLYFDRHDGQACTIEDWLQVFQDATGRDLSQFKLWYSQAGTPRLSIDSQFKDGTYHLTLRQETPPTPGQSTKSPMVIPVAMGLLGDDGSDLIGTQVLELTRESETFTFHDIPNEPTLSILRGFSAPVILTNQPSIKDRLFLMAHDSDAFNRWESGRSLGREIIIKMVTDRASAPVEYFQALAKTTKDTSLDPAFRALCLAAPCQDDIAQSLFDMGRTPDPVAIHNAVDTLRSQLAQHLKDDLSHLYTTHQVHGPYCANASDCGKRALGNMVLGLLTRLDAGAQAQQQYDQARNMTQQMAALSCLISAQKGDDALQAFYDQWSHERLVIDKWFGVQVSRCKPEQAAGIAHKLTQHPDFTLSNPNRFRALFGPLAMTAPAFHGKNGTAYELLVDNLIALDKLNPQLAARMVTVFESWKRYDDNRQEMICIQLQKLQSQPDLSRNTREMVDRILG